MCATSFTRRALTVAAAACAATLTLAIAAHAGNYTIYTCRLPNSTFAPTDGWAPDAEQPGIRHTDTCRSGGSLQTAMDADGFPTTMRRGWRWESSPGTTLLGITLWRTFRLGAPNDRATPYRDLLAGSRELEVDSSAAPPLGTGNVSSGDPRLGFHPTNRVPHPDLRDNVIKLRIGCTGFDGAFCPGGGGLGAEQMIFAAHFLLEDLSNPVPGTPTGALAKGGVHRGTESVTFTAADQGSGVYRGVVEIDGVPVHREIIDANGGKCADAYPADPDPFQFVNRVPCKLSANGTVRFDTTTVPDGPHEIRISVEDAAGNRATVFGAEPVTIQNGPVRSAPAALASPAPPPDALTPPSPIGRPLAPPSAARTITLTATAPGAKDDMVRSAYGRRVPISGTIRNADGNPMSGARIDVTTLLRVPRAKARTQRPITTDASGAFRYLLPAGPSRTITFAHGAGPAAKTSIDVRVRARLSLRLSRRKLRNGSAARYSGTLAGPNAGRKLVDVQVIVGRQWRPVCSARTTARGRYACRYRFKRTFRTTRYTFRARVRRQETLPYEPSQSVRRRLTVLP